MSVNAFPIPRIDFIPANLTQFCKFAEYDFEDERMTSRDCIELGRLLTELRGGIENLFPDRVWVKAEIASIQVKSSGHCYMDLCQSGEDGVEAKVKAVVWRSRWLPLSAFFREVTGSDPAPGMTIVARVQVNFTELYGLSLVIDELEPQATLGEAELRRRETIARLQEEGLMDRQQQMEIPALPYRLAVISAPDAAGYGDFCRHLSDNQYGFRFCVKLFPALMQGQGAPESVRDAFGAILAECEEGNPFDAVLLMRGGGSVLDLSCFDEYLIARSIAECPIPVFTAIGHERDCHVADMVAYRFVKTPTALADEFIDAFAAEDERISGYATRLRLAFASKISAIEARVDMLHARIRAADPRAVLSRGYTLVADSGGVVVRSAAGLSAGDRLTLMFPDGKVEVEVKK